MTVLWYGYNKQQQLWLSGVSQESVSADYLMFSIIIIFYFLSALVKNFRLPWVNIVSEMGKKTPFRQHGEIGLSLVINKTFLCVVFWWYYQLSIWLSSGFNGIAK